jgi:hypothetical protein
MTEYRNYAQMNTFTVTGRVLNAEIVDGKYGEFLAVTVITNGKTDGQEFCIKFNDSSSLLGLQKSGWLPSGRVVTLVGHIVSLSETYEKDGQTNLRKRPEMELTNVVIPDGGLGPMPKEKMPSTASQVTKSAPVDKAPTLEEIAF